MHPIEHLRYVARSRGSDPTSIARETAAALGGLHGDAANLLIACRRIIERHPAAGPLWWLATEILLAPSPHRRAWAIADELDDDPTARRLAAAMPDAADVVTVGWPDVVGEALMRRGDAIVHCVDAEFEAQAFAQRLERAGVDSVQTPFEHVGRCIAAADVVMIEAWALDATRAVAPLGSYVLAAVASSIGTPVWLSAGLGRRLPGAYVEAIVAGARTHAADRGWPFDEVPLTLVSHLATSDGVAPFDPVAFRADCPVAAELLPR